MVAMVLCFAHQLIIVLHIFSVEFSGLSELLYFIQFSCHIWAFCQNSITKIKTKHCSCSLCDYFAGVVVKFWHGRSTTLDKKMASRLSIKFVSP